MFFFVVVCLYVLIYFENVSVKTRTEYEMLGYEEAYTTAVGLQWSAASNCQQYARHLLQMLGFTWPADMGCTGDALPVLIDAALWANSVYYYQLDAAHSDKERFGIIFNKV